MVQCLLLSHGLFASCVLVIINYLVELVRFSIIKLRKSAIKCIKFKPKISIMIYIIQIDSQQEKGHPHAQMGQGGASR